MSKFETRTTFTQRRSVMRRRTKAFSLVELVVGLTGGSLVFLLAIGVVEIAMKLSSDASSQTEHQLAMARLGSQLRNDVHDATEVSATESDGQLQLTLKMQDKQEIHYRAVGSEVKRESTVDEATAREIYRLAQNRRVRFELADPQRVEMTILRVTPEGEILESRVLAHVGRFLASRFTTSDN